MMLRNSGAVHMPTTPPPWVWSAVHHRPYKFALFVALAVICVFLSHSPGGPWSAVHGPATALQAARYALTIFLLIALAASSFVSRMLDAFLPAGADRSTAEQVWPQVVVTVGIMPIRC